MSIHSIIFHRNIISPRKGPVLYIYIAFALQACVVILPILAMCLYEFNENGRIMFFPVVFEFYINPYQFPFFMVYVAEVTLSL